jgi:hypothetical protein
MAVRCVAERLRPRCAAHARGSPEPCCGRGTTARRAARQRRPTPPRSAAPLLLLWCLATDHPRRAEGGAWLLSSHLSCRAACAMLHAPRPRPRVLLHAAPGPRSAALRCGGRGGSATAGAQLHAAAAGCSAAVGGAAAVLPLLAAPAAAADEMLGAGVRAALVRLLPVSGHAGQLAHCTAAPWPAARTHTSGVPHLSPRAAACWRCGHAAPAAAGCPCACLSGRGAPPCRCCLLPISAPRSDARRAAAGGASCSARGAPSRCCRCCPVRCAGRRWPVLPAPACSCAASCAGRRTAASTPMRRRAALLAASVRRHSTAHARPRMCLAPASGLCVLPPPSVAPLVGCV